MRWLAACPMTEVMAEMYGKASGSSRGRGGSMHVFSAAHRFYGGNAIVGRRAAARSRSGACRQDAGAESRDLLLLRRGRRGRG